MLTIPGYQIIEQLYESAHSIVYRAHYTAENTPVILKTLKGEYPTPEQLARFRREYEMTRSLGKVDGIIDAYALDTYNNTLVMVLEDFGAESLTHLLPEHTLTLREFLRLAIRMTGILGRIHQQHIMHKDINPSNIVWNPETDQLKIIDFGISTELPREQPDIRNPHVLEGTLAYMSPEQTGRMNRPIDYRTDFYSLGATLYHLLTGHVPFQADDAMELVHCHLAKMPAPPCDIVGARRTVPISVPISISGEGTGTVPITVPISISGEGTGTVPITVPISISGEGTGTVPLQIISAIILKLMAKNAEDRYQSASGARHDLEWCLANLAGQATPVAGDPLSGFTPAQHDIADRFQIPQKLYGREQEIETLLAAFERVSQSSQSESDHPERSDVLSLSKGRRAKSEIVLVTGYAGIGKTALVHEMHKPIAEKRGYFISGKFDQFTRNIPYSALIQAFQGFVRQLLSEPEEQLVRWKETLLKALGPNGQVMIEVIPDVELILGEQPAVPDVPPHQAKNRFNFVFQKFVRACASAEHPLVIFLDDLQWADLPSLNWLNMVMTDPGTRFMLIVGAYRDNEINDAHPLMLTLREIQKAGATLDTITLRPLALDDVSQFLADTLHSQTRVCTPLAELCLQKTGGNPFFLTQFLRSLHEDGFLEFDGNHGKWTWNLDEIRKREMTDNVVDLMTDKVQQLSEQTQHVLKLAACIGNQFDLRTLSVVHQQSQAATLHDLREALQEELIIPLDDSYKYVGMESPPLVKGGQGGFDTGAGKIPPNPPLEKGGAYFTFLHDRVQQAVYSLIEEEHKKDVHLKIGRLLLLNTSEAEQEDRLFDILNHLNLGRELIAEQSLKDGLAKLNLMAGRRAKDSAAYQAAFTYVQTGIVLLEAESWQRQYQLTLALHTEAAEAAYLSGDFEQMEHLARVVLQRARTLLDKVKIYEVKIEVCKAQNKLLEAVKIGLSVLRLLGVKFPEKPNKFHIWRELTTTKFVLAGKQIEDIVNLPEMTDPYMLAAMRILSSLISAAYFTTDGMLSLIGCKMLTLSVKHGNTSGSAFGYGSYGGMLCVIAGDIDAGYRFGELALDVVNRFKAGELKGKAVHVVNTHIRHWKEHIKEALPPLLAAYQNSLETGDFEYAAFSALSYTLYSYFAGKHLARLEQEMSLYSEFLGQLKQKTAHYYHTIAWQAVLNLMEKTETSTPWHFIGDAYNEEQMLPLHLQANDRAALGTLYCHKLILSYLFQSYPQAIENTAQAEIYLDAITGMPFVPLFHFYDSLARLAVFSDVRRAEQRRILKKVAANQKKMKHWARHAPMNYLHKWYLVEAELARVQGKDHKAADFYDTAIEFAKEYEYLNEEALAHELAAKFYLSKDKTLIARTYMREARYCYLKWGAKAKVQHLDCTYPELLTATDGHHLEGGVHLTETSILSEADARVLDFASFMKASQTMSGEMVLDKLFPRLMDIILENAGADHGMLLFEEEGTWTVKAARDTRPDRYMQSGLHIPVRSGFPPTIITYVARTKEPVVLDNAVQEGSFTQDQYIQTHHPKSVLCLPLLNQGTLIGILYLENHLATNVFTPERVDILQLLSSQAAIAIENATLYTSLEAKVAERTAELEHARQAALDAKQVADDARIAAEAAQQASEAAQRASEAANQAKSIFLSNMSHELRTPLNAILGYTQLLKRDSGLTERQHEAIATIHHSGEHLLMMLNEVLDLSKVEAQKIELEPVNFPLAAFVKSLVEIVRIRAQNKGLTLECELAPDLPTTVYGDAKRLRQILLNLLHNAVKFTEQGGVTLRVARLKIDNCQLTIEAQDRRKSPQQFSIVNLQFSIQDTGIGIPSKHLQDIFLPFHQVSDLRTAREGTGLGLAISQQLVRLMGGELVVESTVGQGTTFWFELELPVGNQVVAGEAVSDADYLQHILGYKGHTRTILVVDDKDENRAFLRDMLVPLGFEVMEAVNGQDAINITHEQQPDLILMDLVMPVVDGFEATRQIRALGSRQSAEGRRQKAEGRRQKAEGSPQHPVPSTQYPAPCPLHPVIIGISASAFEATKQECLEAGCQDFLTKPVEIEQLLECLRHHLPLEWVYAEGAVEAESRKQIASEAAPLIIPPQEMLLKLVESAQSGYINDIHTSVAELQAADPKLIPFAKKIEQFADNFQIEQLLEYLTRCISN